MTAPTTPDRLLADTVWLRRLAYRLTADADQADDLGQEVALAALRWPHLAAVPAIVQGTAPLRLCLPAQ